MTDPRTRAKERKARRNFTILGLAGLLVLALGWLAVYARPTGAFVWTITLIIFGPIMVFMAFLGYYTYLENVEEEKFWPHPEREDLPPQQEAPSGVWPH